MRRPKAILFDLGETLIHFSGIDRMAAFRDGAAAGHAVLRRAGVELPSADSFVRALVWRGRKAMLLNRFSRRELDIAVLFRWVTGVWHHHIAEPVWREFILRIYDALASRSRVDGQAVAVLAALREANVPAALVSNTFVPDFAIDDHLERVGLLAFFKARFYSAGFGWKKPSLGLFRHATRTLGVRPADAWHVGDAPVADMLGARRAGLTGILRLPAGGKLPWWWPYRRQPTIHELGELLPMAGIRSRAI